MKTRLERSITHQKDIKDEINEIFEDLQLNETAIDLWILINQLIMNSIRIEKELILKELKNG